MQIHVPFKTCYVISFNGQGLLCPLTWAEWRDLSNHTKMNTVQPRTPEKKAKKKTMWKFPWKSCSTTHLPFLSSNPKILKTFLKTFPTRMKPNKCLAKEKKRQEKWKREEERKRISKSQDCCVTFNPNLKILLSPHARTLRANILHLDQKAAKRQPVNDFAVSFSSL